MYLLGYYIWNKHQILAVHKIPMLYICYIYSNASLCSWCGISHVIIIPNDQDTTHTHTHACAIITRQFDLQSPPPLKTTTFSSSSLLWTLAVGSLLPSLVLSFQGIFLGSVVVVKLSERADRWNFTALEKDPCSINHRSLDWSLNRRTFSLDSLETEGDRDSMSPLAFLLAFSWPVTYVRHNALPAS